MKNYVITISRLCGSGGSTVARILAEKLQIPLYDRHLLSEPIEEQMSTSAPEKAADPLFNAAQNIYANAPLPPEGSEPTTACILIFKIFHKVHVFHNHQCNPEGNGIFKDPKIQSRCLLQLIQTVNQCITMDKQLS